MKQFIPALVFLLFITACNNSADTTVGETDTTMSENIYSWQASLNDSTDKLEIKKMANGGPDTLEANAVINFLNAANPSIKLQWVKNSNDTIFIKIPDAMYLTQQMGSSGPTIYMATAVYNLTEIPGIKFVRFDFEEGDHAAPGTYSRDSFKEEQ